MDLDARFERIERLLERLVEQSEPKGWYTVEEFAVAVHREPFTVRQWCNLGRIHAEKSGHRCGPAHQWAIPHSELERYRQDGLLPLPDGVNYANARERASRATAG